MNCVPLYLHWRTGTKRGLTANWAASATRRRGSTGMKKSPERRSTTPTTIADAVAAGIDLVCTDPDALEAFRFANRTMWRQRVHTEAIETRRGDPGHEPARRLSTGPTIPTIGRGDRSNSPSSCCASRR